ncbi:protein kinase family protein [Nonomuraea phyllanthi]|uniref:serine/threonine-protein kinase n=1 Tax=Nonomuraea phyllanthi TaxID=2219224 RepID=UPI0012937DB9|nr:serine/threonine-protein kinase [Nonomuraea phyllanthi]QFY13552.1 protein kinase family protein [Nonomuraea phyllanthi]
MDPSRTSAHDAVATSLSLLSDHALGELVERATPLGAGVGGQTMLLEVAGRPVFVKRLPLTDRECLPEHVRSTADLYGLPSFCHIGMGAMGGPGFGAWRELAAHVMTTEWVLAGQFAGFPLMYHWRVLPGDPAPLPDDLADVDRVVAYWGGGQEIRDRVEGLRASSASLVLFLEHFPYNLHEWLEKQMRAGDGSANAACELVERELESGAAFMSSQGLVHFDAHFKNILTDGHRLYFSDFGLSLSSRFDLTPEEVAFLRGHRTYDLAYTRAYLVLWLVAELYGHGRDRRDELMPRWAAGEKPAGVPEGAATVLARHSPRAVVMDAFFRKFCDDDRRTPYPEEEIARLRL